MKMPEMILNKSQLFALFGLFWVGFGWLSVILALLGVFYNFLLYGYLFLVGGSFLYVLVLNKEIFKKIKWPFFLVLGLSLLAIFIFSYFSTPTIFSGRDQGTLSESAIRLTQNHRLNFSFEAEEEFFKIYGAGKALNFPGFDYTAAGELIPHFPVGYIAWLAAFYAIFGLSGLILANGFSFLVFTLSFYLLARCYLKAKPALVAILLVLTAPVFVWFFKFTLSENLALALLWFSIYQFVLFLNKKDRFYLTASFLSLGLLTFVRIETLAFGAVMLGILFIKSKIWQQSIFQIIGKRLAFVLGGMFLIYLFGLFVNSEFYVVLVKGIIKSVFNIQKELAGSGSLSFFHVLNVFTNYALLGFLALGALGIIYAWKGKKNELLIPFLIASPAFIYLLAPSISGDHPWMLRRFIFAVIPASILYSVWFLDYFFQKKIYFYIFSGLFLAANIWISAYYLSFYPNKNLLAQVQQISTEFNSNDLILVDREATGDPWSMMTGPLSFLYGKQAVYFFNPNDMRKIDSNNFENVYFIIPDKSIDFYKKDGLYEKLEIRENYAINNVILQNTSAADLPEKKEINIQGKIYLFKK